MKSLRKRMNKNRMQTNVDDLNEGKKRPTSTSKKKVIANAKNIIKSKPKLSYAN